MTRRTWIEAGAAALAAGSPLAAAEPAAPAASAVPAASAGPGAEPGAAAGVRTKLGYDAYSIRDLKWKAIEHIDYAASLQLDMVQLSVPGDFASLDAGHLDMVKTHAAERGIELSLATGCICPTSPAWSPANGSPESYLARGGAVAARLGGRSLRVFIATPPDRHSKVPAARQPIDAHIESTLKALRLARSRMVDLGVRVLIENHGDLTARELRALVEAAGADLVGVNYDSGNPMWVMEDPAQALEVLAPYVEVSHFRDSALFEHPRGAAFQWVAMGDGSIGIDGVVARYRELCPGKPVLLEIITGRPPQMVPYLEEAWWNGCERIPGSDFARFVGLVKQGHAYLGPMVIGAPGANPESVTVALREQQRLDLERSLRYSRQKLALGLRGAA
jgi:sugar phosphate isomerase/epimerase